MVLYLITFLMGCGVPVSGEELSPITPQTQVSKLFSSPKKLPFQGLGCWQEIFPLARLPGQLQLCLAPCRLFKDTQDPHPPMLPVGRSGEILGNPAQHLPWHTPSPAHTETAYW